MDALNGDIIVAVVLGESIGKYWDKEAGLFITTQ